MHDLKHGLIAAIIGHLRYLSLSDSHGEYENKNKDGGTKG